MDRRVLFAALILFAGGATGVGVAVFAFVGIDDTTADTEVLWTSEPAAGDDGTGAVVATVDGDPYVIQPATVDETGVLRALDADGDVTWTAPLPDGIDPGGTSDPVVADVDGDAVVVFTTAAGDLVVLEAADGTERFSASVTDGPTVAPAAVDLDGDGTAAFAVLEGDGTLVAVDAAGELLFEAKLAGDAVLDALPVAGEEADGSESAGSPSGRLAGSGIAALTEDADGQHVSVVDADGEVVWTTRPDGTALNWNVADSRRGGVVALGGADGALTTLEVTDGTPRYEVGLQDVPVDVGEPTAGRIHVGGVGDVWAVDLLDGEVVWKQQYGGDTRVNAPATGDVTGDGSLETVAVNRDGGVLALNRNGEAVVRGDAGGIVAYGSPLTADVTGDGRAEILVVGDDGTVVALGT